MLDSELIELNQLIKNFEKEILKEKNPLRKQEYESKLNDLKLFWKEITEASYPMVKYNEKLVNIKTLIKEQERKDKKNKFTPPNLDNIINRTTKETDLVNSLYDKNYVSDVPDPYRKRKKR